jgi:serine/threonine protein kinase
MDDNKYIGKQIGNYIVIAEIKGGSFGSVYQGKHIIFKNEPIVAIKLLHTHLNSTQQHDQFIQEAQILRKLKHPNILPILDAGIHENIPYLVTEYAVGGSLRVRINKELGRPLPLEEALKILSQIGFALQYAHERKVVHRDIKPDNILFNLHGEALLADFGIAIILATSGTKELGRGGTPAYMAPEQFDGIVSTKSDQYALGCIAYELVTGSKPYTVPNPTIEAMWYQHAKVDPIAPTRLNPLLPKHVERSILKALAKQRIERFENVSAFIAELQMPSSSILPNDLISDFDEGISTPVGEHDLSGDLQMRSTARFEFPNSSRARLPLGSYDEDWDDLEVDELDEFPSNEEILSWPTARYESAIPRRASRQVDRVYDENKVFLEPMYTHLLHRVVNSRQMRLLALCIILIITCIALIYLSVYLATEFNHPTQLILPYIPTPTSSP